MDDPLAKTLPLHALVDRNVFDMPHFTQITQKFVLDDNCSACDDLVCRFLDNNYREVDGWEGFEQVETLLPCGFACVRSLGKDLKQLEVPSRIIVGGQGA